MMQKDNSLNCCDDVNFNGEVASTNKLSFKDKKSESEYFCSVVCTIIEKLFAVNPSQTGSETQDSSSEESSVYSDDNSTNDSQHACSNKNYKSGKNACLHNLGEAQARKFKLMNSLVKILKLIDNGKICIISSFVLIDKLSMIGDVIPSEDLHWTLMVCICLASKLLNDRVFSNRIFAYYLNIDLKEYNKMELEIVKRLGFDFNIQEEMYNVYYDEITKFSETQQDSLLESLEEYQINKKKIREYRHMIKMSRGIQKAKITKEPKSPYDFCDKNIKNMIEKRGLCEQNTVQPYYISKFRFESYNSYGFKCDPHFNKIIRSRSESRYD